MKRTFAILLYIYVFLAAVTAQEVNVTAKFDTSRIFLGDQINYTLTVDKPASFLLSIPVFKDTLQKNLEILKGPVSDTSFLKDGRMRIRNSYLITSFDSGFYRVPPVYAELNGQNGIKRFYSDYALLEVMRVKIAPADTAAKIYDIIKPYKAPLTIGEVLPWVLIILVAAALFWYIMRVIKKIRINKTGEVPVVNPDPAHIIAFRELEKLKEENLCEKGQIKLHYSRLTEIIRQYLENRYGINSLEMTTVETLAELIKAGFKNDENYKKLKTILTGADLVKFAKYNPDASEIVFHFDNSWEFVNSTKIEEPVPASDVEDNGRKEVVV
jgi:hypothetical protein